MFHFFSFILFEEEEEEKEGFMVLLLLLAALLLFRAINSRWGLATCKSVRLKPNLNKNSKKKRKRIKNQIQNEWIIIEISDGERKPPCQFRCHWLFSSSDASGEYLSFHIYIFDFVYMWWPAECCIEEFVGVM